jgi:translation initiation factor IF-2
MSEERVIRINKILRELNISLDRAVDFLKEKGHEIESSPNAKISQEEYKVLCGQFSADKGNKVASLEVSEEKRKEKEALKRELEKEQEAKRLQEEERQRQEIIKAKAVLSAPKAVGKIDLDPKKQEVKSEKPVSEEKPVIVSEEKPVVAEVKPVETKVSEPVKTEVKEEVPKRKTPSKKLEDTIEFEKKLVHDEEGADEILNNYTI